MPKTKQQKDLQKGEIIIYKPKTGTARLEVKLAHESLWLNQKQMSELFKTERSVITKHINNVFKTGELNKNSVCANFAHTALDGKTYNTNFYNLDMIISVGYRVNSKQGTQFRIWATKTLRDYIIKGVVINQKRLKEQRQVRLGELKRTVTLLEGVIDKKSVEEVEAKGFLRVITDYANTWVALENYDKKSVNIKKGKKSNKTFEYEKVKEIIKQLKKKLLKQKQAGRYFGVERVNGLSVILGKLNKTIKGEQVYKSIEEKAVNLFYYVIKEEVFIDGNKRIASLLFLLMLPKKKLNEASLVALALLVSESKPKEKDVIIALITNLLI